MDAVVLAGGRGTRLGSLTADCPKPLIPICGKPILGYILDWLRKNKVQRIIVSTNYKAEKIHQYLEERGDGAEWVEEKEPLGTAGAIRELAGREKLSDPFLVLYGDELVNIELAPMLKFHRKSKAEVTLLVGPSMHPHDSDLLELDGAGRLLAMHPKPHPEGTAFHNLGNKALYIMSRRFVSRIPRRAPADFGREVFPSALRQGARMFGYKSSEYVFDAGTHQRLSQAELDVKEGRYADGSRATPRPCVFLDRDGVINREINGVLRPEMLEILPGVPKAIARLNLAGALVIVATNQPFVAKGQMSLQQLDGVHKKLEWELGKEGAYLDAIYFCPHHPEKGWKGEVKKLKIRCGCRKPKAGMIKAALRDFNIDLRRSILIGDSERDVLLAQKAGISYYKPKTNSSAAGWLSAALRRMQGQNP